MPVGKVYVVHVRMYESHRGLGIRGQRCPGVGQSGTSEGGLENFVIPVTSQNVYNMHVCCLYTFGVRVGHSQFCYSP